MIYPQKLTDDVIYFVEFYDSGEFSLYQRNFIFSKDKWQQMVKEGINHPLMSREGHPLKLTEGELLDDEDCIALETKKFLIFLVDSLNKNCNNK